jgi:hypothetical protein
MASEPEFMKKMESSDSGRNSARSFAWRTVDSA